MSNTAGEPWFAATPARKKSIFNFKASGNRNPRPVPIAALARVDPTLPGMPDLYFTGRNVYCFSTDGHFVFFILEKDNILSHLEDDPAHRRPRGDCRSIPA
ncbi:hypothetical protein JWG42_14065 [Desulfoprunum benzoelyticum]|uniref:Uncharacterized protein n=1 Tax=Desulfoprunum benzoelyticum TaxID=1506996 RepID=A0A840V3S5_9BACT|nr:hypothetical protein [Desulfoprunum benzoelyticum]MBB5348510.1 hypothetical protein [Desulfoprunum benzoelyticum]MBM9531281.1 hypothetical protein [Desulfoprunum benzoelyticum]